MTRKKSFLFLLLSLGFLLGAAPGHSEETGKVVRAVDVKGNKSISTMTVLAKVKTQVGQPVSSTVLNEDLKRLYGLGFFTDVRIEQEDMEDGVKVVFIVVEKPVLSKIVIEGNHKIGKDAIKKEMRSVVGDFVDQKRVRDDVEAVKKLYEKKGFSEARVDSSLEVEPDTNQAALRVLVDEGAKVRLRDVHVVGNKALKAGDIKKRIKTKTIAWWGLFRSGYLNEDDLVEDVERVKAFYDENGFSDAEVTTETEPIKGSSDLILKIIVNEGKKYVVGDVQINGNSILTTPEITKAVKMGSGAAFSRRGLRLDVANIQDLYFEKGYLSAQIRSESVYNESTDKVDVVYSITENELTYVGRVIVQGNTKTKDIVIRRELRAYPGESYSGAKLKRSKERLYNLGFFEDVRLDTQPGESPNTRDLIVTVKEAKTGEFSFGGGYSSIDSVIGFAQIRQKNFDWRNTRSFTGAGQDFALRFELGSVRQNAELSFTEPWFFGHPYSFGFDLFKRELNRSGSAGYFFDQSRLGGDLRLGKEFNEYDKGLLMYKLESVDISNIRDNASQALKDEAGENTTSSVALTLTRDYRNNIFNPSEGFMLSGTSEVAGGPLGGDRDFYRFTGIGSTYIPNFYDKVLELKIRGGIVDSYSDSTTVPIYERFFIGGANTVRGYRERRIGPRDPGNQEAIGGETYWVLNVEEGFPIYPDLIKGALFFDAGALAEEVDDFGGGEVFKGVGAGVRIKTPIGPVRLDAGYPLDEIEGDKKKVRFYFNISQGF
ncbi:MAG: outer membrane protein assembly factor BamA [Candidatus Omnitrophica bacterium]|nr:outer membrane protein assembly factor BamA [Candidatus Omnitrophota bacterium]